jgi:hypothetical protein
VPNDRELALATLWASATFMLAVSVVCAIQGLWTQVLLVAPVGFFTWLWCYRKRRTS